MKNPNRIKIKTCFNDPEWVAKYRVGIKRGHPWNYGLSKETDDRITEVANKLRGRSQDLRKNPGKANTDQGEIDRRIKISNTMKKNKNAGGIRKNSGRGKKGTYGGYHCDSTYELVYVIYNIDHNIKFERCNIEYEYEYNSAIHKYHPDFILEDGTLIEIKGYMTDVVGVKLNAVQGRKIRLMLKGDLKYAFDYVKQTYSYRNLEDLYDKSGEV